MEGKTKIGKVKYVLWAVLGIVALVVVVAGIVLLSNDDKTGQLPEAASVKTVSITTSKLPEGWKVSASDDQNVVLEKGDLRTCFVAVNKIADKVVKVTDATEYLQVQKENLTQGATSKGYTLAALPVETIPLQTNQGIQSIKALEFNVSGPESMRQSYGYLVRDGFVVQVQRSCVQTADMPETLEALKAVEVQI